MRKTWEQYFMDIARQVATRSTCDRRHVGAIIVRDRSILSTGYNGSIKGLAHCDDVGHMMEDGHCIRTVHAEANAIVQAANNGVSINNSDIYITSFPCLNCFKLIANAGINRVYYCDPYPANQVFELAKLVGIEMIELQTIEESGCC